MSIPSPRPLEPSKSPPSQHVRRPSLPISPTLSPRAAPVPVPQRHGSLVSRKRPSFDAGSYGSLSSSLPASVVLAPRDATWLDTPVGQILHGIEANCPVVDHMTGTEEAVEMLLKSSESCLLVQKGDSHGFFDVCALCKAIALIRQYSDLNAFLLVVLQASGSSALDAKSHKIASLLRRGIQVPIGDLCDLSRKSPFYSYSPDTTLRTVLPVFASGVHRVGVLPHVLTDVMLLRHLVTQHCLVDLNHPVSTLAASPAISLSGSASVLDAMQVMSIQGLGALGVLRARNGSDSSGSSVTSSPDPFDLVLSQELLSVVTCRDCASLVVPSEGKKVLGMTLEDLVKGLQVSELAGQARGEERFPVHTITSDTSILHASHLILATASSRIFVRTVASSPPISPLYPPSPSRSFTDLREVLYEGMPGLPPPPPSQLSSNQVVAITDILGFLVRSHALKAHVERSEEQPLARRRRFSTLEPSENLGFESWRWTK